MRERTDVDLLTDLVGAVPMIVANTAALREVGSVEVAEGLIVTTDGAVELVRSIVYDGILTVSV
jgi:hypothetical protein